MTPTPDPMDRAAEVLTPRVRAYLYRVLTAVGAVLVLHGLVDGEHLEAYLLLAANVLGTGLAAAKTPLR